ncbi:probable pectinesterase 29 [Malania oleifera]|uniref:probable pectinesterase 29 n=1 Tax=Malania oleifera TaxID=397392 RepID=UPI0025AE9DB7|nr:probable pectinesterase 29 [Malania oleifera]
MGLAVGSRRHGMSYPLFQWCFLIALFLGVFGQLSLGSGQSSGDPFVIRTIVVDKSGHGHFSTIQAAVDAIPWNSQKWICIFVKAGLYEEKVIIPKEKPYIYLKGEGKRKTNVVWDDHDSVVQSPTFMSMADNFFAKSITFTNSYNLPTGKNGNPRTPAVAAMIAGDNSSFYRCGFHGVQDTLWDFQGRHYFKRCTISGAVDFIFGSGQSIYDRCTIAATAATLGPGLSGYITAQGRSSPEETNGFVFKGCNVVGTGTTLLGRPWRGYARVLFYNTNMSHIVVPRGWDAWYSASREHQLTFAEESCYGVGSDMSQRVEWVKKLSQEKVKELTSMNFIGGDAWIRSQPRTRILSY